MTKTTQYKNTPIGPIPTDWEVKNFGGVVKIEGGSQPPLKNFIYEKREGYIRLIQTRDYRTDKYITYIPIELAKKFCKKDDIIIGRYGPPIFQIFKGLEGAYNVALMKAIPNLDIVDKDYTYYFISRPELRSYLEGLSQRSGGQTGVEIDRLNEYPFPLPPLPEQQKIAEVLSTWDKAIQETDAIIKKLQDRNKALAFSLLTGKKRVNEVEDKWDNYKLEHFLEEYSSKPDGKIDLPVFTSSKNGLMSQSDYYSGGRISSRENVDYNIIPDGYITYRSRSDDGLFTFNKNTTGYDGLISGYYPVFKIVNGNDDFFLFYLNFFKNKLTKYSTGTSQLVLSLKALKSATFHLPSLEEQNAIAEILNTANQEVKQYQQKLEALKLQKKGLMQQLLTGKLRTI